MEQRGEGLPPGPVWAPPEEARDTEHFGTFGNGAAYEPRPVDAPEYQPPSPVREDKPFWKRIGGGIIAIGILLAKLGAKLKFLLFLLPKAKFAGTAISMLVSIGAYTLIWGWKFAVGFVLLLLVHEMGHVFQLRREGVKASAPMFIPFLGAAIAAKSFGKDAAAEARVGLAGPILGSIGCLIPLGLFALTGNDLFRALAFIGFFLNLVNLLPVLPLDGGRAMAALTPWMWIVGFAALMVLTFFFPSPILFLVLLFGGMETYRRFQQRKSPEGQRYHSVSPRTRVAVALVYLGLAALLTVALNLSHLPRTPGDA